MHRLGKHATFGSDRVFFPATDAMLKRATKTGIWIAWAITLGETLLLVTFGVVLGLYWLMLPVWLRSSAATGLALASLVVGYRIFKFRRNQKTIVAPQIVQAESSLKTEPAAVR